ncbi:serum amyloid A-5 protein-like isoform X2 [Arvicola amphibius]|uniref:serum amyloid A-5 protein-like isoform X2 n=1 Tax=Arvicola amphibius TaxID=1047088 RepID=UPI0018E3D00C|nr:serum amyloid A-5 protein-like isoform X2 [Arvicola amphibius]
MQDQKGYFSTSQVTVYIGRPSHISSVSNTSCSPKVSAGTDSPSRMKTSIAMILCLLVLGVDSQRWLEFIKEAGQGTRDMWRAYSDMREANWIGADKYFHARGNYDAAQRGPGGVWAAEVLSDLRENIQSLIGRGHEDSMADQEANRWGRSGKDPNHYRPRGLPDKY